MDIVDLSVDDSEIEIKKTKEIRKKFNELKKYIPFLTYIHDLDPVPNAKFIKIVKWLKIEKNSTLSFWKLKTCELTIKKKYTSLKTTTIFPKHIMEIFEGETTLIVISDEEEEDQPLESNSSVLRENTILTNISQPINKNVITAEQSSSPDTIKSFQNLDSNKQHTRVSETDKVSSARAKRGRKELSSRRKRKYYFQKNSSRKIKRKIYYKMKYSHKKKTNNKSKPDASDFDILSWDDLENQNKANFEDERLNNLFDNSPHPRPSSCEYQDQNSDYESPKKKKKKHNRKEKRNDLPKTPDLYLPDLENTVDIEQGIQNQSYEDLIKKKMQLESELLQIEDKKPDIFDNEAHCVLPKKSNIELFQRRNSIRCDQRRDSTLNDQRRDSVRCDDRDSSFDPVVIGSLNSVLQKNPKVVAELVQNSQGTKIVFDYAHVTKVQNSSAIPVVNAVTKQPKSNIIQLPNKICIDIDDVILSNLSAIIAGSPKNCEMNNNICPKSVSGDAYRKAMHQEQNNLTNQGSMQQFQRPSLPQQQQTINKQSSPYKTSCGSALSCLNKTLKSPNISSSHSRTALESNRVENVNQRLNNCAQLKPLNRIDTLARDSSKSASTYGEYKRLSELEKSKQSKPHCVKNCKPENKSTKSETNEKEKSKDKSLERKANQTSSSKTIETNKNSSTYKQNLSDDDEEVIMSFPGRLKSRRRIESWSSSEDFEPSTVKIAPRTHFTPSKNLKSIPVVSAKSEHLPGSSSNSPKTSVRKSKDSRESITKLSKPGSTSDQKKTKMPAASEKDAPVKSIKENRTKPKNDTDKIHRVNLFNVEPKTDHKTAKPKNNSDREELADSKKKKLIEKHDSRKSDDKTSKRTQSRDQDHDCSPKKRLTKNGPEFNNNNCKIAKPNEGLVTTQGHSLVEKKTKSKESSQNRNEKDTKRKSSNNGFGSDHVHSSEGKRTNSKESSQNRTGKEKLDVSGTNPKDTKRTTSVESTNKITGQRNNGFGSDQEQSSEEERTKSKESSQNKTEKRKTQILDGSNKNQKATKRKTSMESINKIIDHPVKKTKPQEEHIPPPTKPKNSPSKRLYRELSNLTCTFKESLLPATIGRRRCSTNWFNSTKKTQQKSEDNVNVENAKLTAAPIQRRRQTTWLNLTKEEDNVTVENVKLTAAPIQRRRQTTRLNLTKEDEQKSEDNVNVEKVKLTAAPIYRRRQTTWLNLAKEDDQKSEENKNVENVKLTAAPIHRRRKTCSGLPPIRLTIGLSTDRKEYCVRSNDSGESSNGTDDLGTNQCLPNYKDFINRELKVALKRISHSSCESLNSPTTKTKPKEMPNPIPSDAKTPQAPISSLVSNSNKSPEKYTTFFNVDKNMTYKSTKTCALCNKKPHDLTNHYVSQHHTESYISRLSCAEISKLEENESLAIPCRKNRYKITCAFCKEELEDSFENLPDHFSYHTGEYNFQCGGCKIIKPYKADVGSHQQRTRLCRNSKIRTLCHYESDLAIIYLYVCKLCNFGNMNEANVGKHLRNEHKIKSNEEKNIKKCILAAKDLRKNCDTTVQSHGNETRASSLSPERLMKELHAQNNAETKVTTTCKSPERILDEFHASLVESKKSISSSHQVFCQSPEKLLEDLFSQNNTETKVTDVRSSDESTCKSPERLLEELHASDSLGENDTEISSSNEALNQNTEMLLEDLQNSQTRSNIVTVTQSSTEATKSNPKILLEVLHDSVITIDSKSTNKITPASIKSTTEAPCETPEILLEELHAPTSPNKAMSDDANTSNDVLSQHPGKLLEESHVSEPLAAMTNIHNPGTTYQVERKKLSRSLFEHKIETQSKHSMNYRQYTKADSKNFGLLKCMTEDCLFSTNSDEEFKIHMLNNHIDYNETDKFDCLYCVEEIYSLDNLMRHIWRQHGMSKYQCGECSYRSMEPGNVIIHRRMCHNDIKTTKPIYKCYSREANKSKQKAVTKKIKENIASLKCPDCSSCFYAVASIKSHIQKSHPLTFQKFSSLKFNKFACIHCTKKESNCKEMMQIHMMLHHPDEPGFIIERTLSPQDCKDSLEHLVRVNISPNVLDSGIEIIACEERKSPDVISSKPDKETPTKSEKDVNQLNSVNSHQQQEQPVQTEKLVLTRVNSTRKPCRSSDINVLKHSSPAKECRSETKLIPESTLKTPAKVREGSSVEANKSEEPSSKNPQVPRKNQQPKVKKGSSVVANKPREISSINTQVPLKSQQPKFRVGSSVEANKSEETSSKNPQVSLKNQQPKVGENLSVETIKPEETSSNNPKVPLKKQQLKVKEGSTVEANKSEERSSENPHVPLKNQQPKVKVGSSVEANNSEETSSKNPQVQANKSEETTSENPQVPLKNQQPKVKLGSSVEADKSEETSSENPQVPFKNKQAKVEEGSSVEANKSEKPSSKNPQVPLKNQQPKVKVSSSVEANKSEETSSENPQVSLKNQQPKVKEGSSVEANNSEETSSKNPQFPLINQQPKVKVGSSVEATRSEETSIKNPQVPLKNQHPKVKQDSSVEANKSEEPSSKNPQVPLKNQQPNVKEGSSLEANKSDGTSSNNLQVAFKNKQPKVEENSSVETIKSEETSSNNLQIPLANQQHQKNPDPESLVKPCESIVHPDICESQHNEQSSALEIIVIDDDNDVVTSDQLPMQSSNNSQVPVKNQQPNVKENSSVKTIKSEETSSNNLKIAFTTQQPLQNPEPSVKPCESVVNPTICESQPNELSSTLETIVIDDDNDVITLDQSPKEPIELVKTNVITQNPPTQLETKERKASEYWNAAVIKEGPRIGPLLELLVEQTGIHSSVLYRCTQCNAPFMHFELWLTHMKNKHKITADVHCPYCYIELALDAAESHFRGHRRHEHICFYCIASFCSYEKIREHFALCHENHSTIQRKIANFYVVMKHDIIIFDYTALLQDFADAIYRHFIEIIKRNTINEWLPGLTDSCFDEMEVPQYIQADRPLFKCFMNLCSFVGSDENSLDTHLVQHEVPKTFQCSYCLFRLANPNWESIKFHYLLHQTPSLHICCVCKFVHYNSEGMTKHLINLHNSRDVPVLCLSRNDLNYKVSLSIVFPPNETTFTTSKACFCCSLEIRNSNKFLNHLRKDHKLSICPRCRICGKIILTQCEAKNHCKDHQMVAFQLEYEIRTPYFYNLTVKSRSPLKIELSLRDSQKLVTNESTSVSIEEEVVVVKNELQEKTQRPSISLKCLNTNQLMASPSQRESTTFQQHLTESTTTIMASTIRNTSAPSAGQCFSPSTQPQQVLTNEIPFLTRGHSSPLTTIRNCSSSTVAQNSMSNNAFRYSFTQQTLTTEMSVRGVQQSTSPTETRYSSPFAQPQLSISTEASLPNRSPSTNTHHPFPSTYVRHSISNTTIQYSSPERALPLLSPRAVQHSSADVQRSAPSANSLNSSSSLQLQSLPNRRLSTNIGYSSPSTGIRYSMLATAQRNSSPNQPISREVPIRGARPVQNYAPGMDVRYSAPFTQPQEAVTTAALMPNLMPIQNSTPSTYTTRHPSQHKVISEIQLGTGRAVISIPPSAFQAPIAERPEIAQTAQRISVITSPKPRIEEHQSVVRTAGTASVPQLSNTNIQTHQSTRPNIDELVPFCGNCYRECSDFIHLQSHHEATHACNNERFYFYVDRKIACMHCHYRGAVESFARHHATFHPDQLQLCRSVTDPSRCGICNDVFRFPSSSANNLQALPVCACPNRERVLADCLDLPTLRALQDIGYQYFKYSCDFCAGCFESFHQYNEHFAIVHQQYVDTALSKTKGLFYCCVCSEMKSYKMSDVVNHIRLSHVIQSGLTFPQAYNEFYRKIRIFHPFGFTVCLGDLRNTGEFDEESFKRAIYLNEARCQSFWSSQTEIN